MSDLQAYFQQATSKDVVISYKGLTTASLLNSLIEVAETKISGLEDNAKIKKKVFNILVEMLQNIHHHFLNCRDKLKQHEDADYIVFVLGKEGPDYKIIAGNFVKNSEVESLSAKIDEINSKNAEDLKAMYRETLSQGEVSSSGGAGLGIIDIARRSGAKLEYRFEPGIQEHAFFSLKVKVSL